MTDQEARDEREVLVQIILQTLSEWRLAAIDVQAAQVALKLEAACYRKTPEPKPWEEAKDGEIWVLTSGGVDLPWTRQADQWVSATPGKLFRRNVDLITAGRRIWPDAAKAVVNERI